MSDDQNYDADDVREIIASSLDMAEERTMSLKEFQKYLRVLEGI
ncbi:hypothetical protein ACKUZO_008525 [Acinetobacter baumannii]